MEENVFLIIAGVGIQNAKKAVTKLQQLNNIQNSKNNKLITNLPEFVY